MKNKTKKQQTNTKNVFLTISFVVISILLGFIISYVGKGNSFIEKNLISSVITLFGFSLTATVFICQSIKGKNEVKIFNLINAISKSLILILILIALSFGFDLIWSISLNNIISLIFKTFKISSLIYCLICQFDILKSFIVIIKYNYKKSDKENQQGDK